MHAYRENATSAEALYSFDGASVVIGMCGLELERIKLLLDLRAGL